MNWRFRELRWRLLPGILAALAIALLYCQGALQSFEQIAYNSLFQLRRTEAWDQRVVVIKIDDTSISQIGRFPWNRQEYVRLLDLLSQAEASVIAFDMLWSEPSPEDGELAEAIAQSSRVVLAQAWDSIGLPLLPLPEFQNVAIASGHILKREESDGIVRKVEAQIQGIPALAIAIIQAYGLVRDLIPLPEPSDLLWVNWAGSEPEIPTYSYVDVVRQKIMAEAFHDKIVLVGVTATGFDPLVTPFERNPPTKGVYLQATLVNNLLAHNLLKLPPVYVWLVLLLGCPGLSYALSRWQLQMQILSGGGLVIGWSLLSLLLFQMHYLIPVAVPILLLISTVAIVVLQERIRMNILLQQQVQQLWQTHHQDLVIRKVDDLKLIAEAVLQQPISMQRVAQLAALAEQFGRSQSAQAAIARSLSVGLLAADLDGLIWFCNPVAVNWLQVRTGEYLQPKLVSHWLSQAEWQAAIITIQQAPQTIVREIHWGDRWLELKIEPLFYPQTQPDSRLKRLDGLLVVLEDITERKLAAIAQAELNQQLTERSHELELVNHELETFSYAVSHDLRAPLRRIDGFSHMLLESGAAQLDEFGQDYLNRIQSSVRRMGELIEDLLMLSRITRIEMRCTQVDLSAIVAAIAHDLQQAQPDRNAKFFITPDLIVHADERLLRTAMENLLGNAWKYTSKRSETRIEFGVMNFTTRHPAHLPPHFSRTKPTYLIRDNGAGFEMAHASRLFGAFQRLHTEEEFPGTGVGLMTTKRIIHRHHGRIWAEGVVDQGATFYFTL